MNLATFLDYIERYKKDASIPFEEADIFFNKDTNELIFIEPNRKIKYDLNYNNEVLLYNSHMVEM